MKKLITTTLTMCLVIVSVSAQNLKPFQGDNDKYGIRDKNGKEIVPHKYGFSQGRYLVRLNDKWRLINKTGKGIILQTPRR